MKIVTFLILFLLIPFLSFGQECKCPNRYAVDINGNIADPEQPIKVFEFSNGKSIGLCGSSETENKDTLYSEFTINICGQNKPIQEWSAIEECYVKKGGDTLTVEEIDWLPIGPNYSGVRQPFYIYKFFFDEDKIKEVTFYRTDLPRYTKAQTKEIFEKYKKLQKGNYEKTTEVAKMLFWAYVSGSKEAEVYLNEIPKKFGPFDGAIAEDWDNISATYEHWKEKNKHK